jgi:hypothetical protein
VRCVWCVWCQKYWLPKGRLTDYIHIDYEIDLVFLSGSEYGSRRRRILAPMMFTSRPAIIFKGAK